MRLSSSRPLKCAALGALLAPLAVSARAGGQQVFAGGWLQKNVMKRVQITGRRVIGLQFQKVEGDQSAYGSLTNYGQGLSRFTDQGNMTVSGNKVLGLLDFSFSLSDNRFSDPANERYTLSYNRNGVDLAYGTIQGSLLNTNPLVSFSRSLEGTMGGYSRGRAAVRFVRSQARSDARTVTLEGNNTPGPYYLQSGRIVNDSLKVLLDGRIQRLGADFNLDADLGSITFVDRSVPPTSAIVVTYEAYGVDARRGSIEGAAASYDFGRFGKLGMTTVRQTAPGAGGGTILRREAFQGYGDPAIPYYLQYVPLTGTAEVRVDGIVQVPGIAGVAGGDYFFDAANPLIFYFRRFIPGSSTIQVTYRPKSTGSVGGSRQVTGMDLRIPLGRLDRTAPRAAASASGSAPAVAANAAGNTGVGTTGAAIASAAGTRGPIGFLPGGLGKGLKAGAAVASPGLQARSAPMVESPPTRGGYGGGYSGGYGGGNYIQAYTATGRLTDAGTGGTARGLVGRYDYRGFILTGTVRDIPATFVSVEGTGFNRNERASEMSLTKRSGSWSYSFQNSNALVSTLTSAAGTSTAASYAAARLVSTAASLSYDGGGDGNGIGGKGVRWTLSHRRDRSERPLFGTTTGTTGTTTGTGGTTGGIASAVRQGTSLDTTDLSASRRAGRFGWTTGLQRQTGFGPVSLQGEGTKFADVGIETGRTALDYFLGRGLSITGRASLSNITSGGKSGQGTDTSATLSLAPTGPWSASATYARSDSGALATLGGFGDSFASGYSGSGFSGTTTAPGTIGGTNVRLATANATYRAGDRLTLSGRVYDQASRGGVTSNAATRAFGLATSYDLRGGNLLNFSLDRSTTSFFSTEAASSSSTTFDAFLAGSPKGPWSYRFGVNTLVSGGGSFAQDSFGLEGQLSHRIDSRQRLTLAGNLGRVRGYYPQDDRSLSFLYDYRLFGNVALTTAYRWRDLRNLDANATAGAFRSSGLSIELSFDFSR